MTVIIRARIAFLPILLLLSGIAFGRAAFAQTDPSGVYSPLFFEDIPERLAGAEIGDYLGLPINAAARLRVDSWDATLVELPENQCREHGSDYGWRGPSVLSIWTEVDKASQKVIAYHTHLSAYGAEQTIWMDGRPHPPDYARHTWEGFSTGHWEGDTLVVETTHLKENWLGLNGVPRSDVATASAHIMKHGNYLTVAAITYDPVYLTEPLIRTTDFVYNPQQELAPWPCEPVDEVDRPPGVVPHHLPGTNKFLDEFARRYGVPFEATRGGAETMYPEYKLKLKNMPIPPPLPKKKPCSVTRGTASERQVFAEAAVWPDEDPVLWPHTSFATSTTNRNFANCSSSVRRLPSVELANPHCGLSESWSMSTYLEASSMRRFSTSLDSRRGSLLETKPSTMVLFFGTKRNGSKVPARSVSYSRKYESTLILLKRTSATGSYPPSPNQPL